MSDSRWQECPNAGEHTLLCPTSSLLHTLILLLTYPSIIQSTGVVAHEVLLAILLVRVSSFRGSAIYHQQCNLLDSDPWSIVSLAFFLRYPNPYAAHVVSCDVVSRTHTDSGSLLTTRLILKRGALPRWAPQGIISRAETWVIEESEVDPFGKTVRCRTKNLDHVKVMQVEESVLFQRAGDRYVGLSLP